MRRRLSDLGWYVVVPIVLAAAIIAGGVFVVYHLARPTEANVCESVTRLAGRFGLVVTDDETVLSCTGESIGFDPAGSIVLRTASVASRTRLLEHACADDSRNTTRTPPRPTHTPTEHVCTSGDTGGSHMTISYDDTVDAGLRLSVSVVTI